jgi:hypothetical protein
MLGVWLEVTVRAGVRKRDIESAGTRPVLMATAHGMPRRGMHVQRSPASATWPSIVGLFSFSFERYDEPRKDAGRFAAAVAAMRSKENGEQCLFQSEVVVAIDAWRVSL